MFPPRLDPILFDDVEKISRRNEEKVLTFVERGGKYSVLSSL